MELNPANLQLLALKPAEDGNGVVLRVQETHGRKAVPRLIWLGEEVVLDEVGPRKIATWRLTPGKKGWRAKQSDILETA